MKAGYTHITFLLDSSISMAKIQGATIEGFNAFLTDQKNAPGKATFTLAEFNTERQYLYKFYDVQSVRLLDTDSYRPRGMTSLYDTIYLAIEETGKELAALHENDRPAGVLFVILTDGEDTASRIYKLAQVKEYIKTQEAVYNWKFIYLGADVDAQQESGKLGLTDYTAFQSNTKSVLDTYTKLSSDTVLYRSSH